jgi:ABC-2 type transport system permease protein
MLSVLGQTFRGRRLALLWWSIGLVGLDVLYVVAFPTLRHNAALDKTFADLSPRVKTLLGLGDGNSITSPVGYLNSQLYANVLPMILLVFSVALAAWSIAGDEASGTLELLLANPISRTRVALARTLAVVAMQLGLSLVCGVALEAMAPLVALDHGVPAGRIALAAIASALLALVFAAVAFAIGAATGRKTIAIGAGAGAAVLGYALVGVAQQVSVLRPLRAVNPWHWMLAADPLGQGFGWEAFLLPIMVSAGFFAIGTIRFVSRDLH